jgi:hypothetical protein
MERVKEWTLFCVAAGSLLTMLMQALHCATETQNYQRAIQALAEIAFK